VTGFPAALILAAAVAASSLVREGANLYATHCTFCHGAQLEGSTVAPSLKGVGAAAVDFMLRTGRMPLEVPGTEPLPAEPQFTPRQLDALTAYVVASGAGNNPPIPVVHVNTALEARGRKLFEDSCEPCHGAKGTGAVAGFGWLAPELYPDAPQQIAEAIRFGPGIMPQFGPHLISDRDLNALVSYVVTFRHQNAAGGYSLEQAGPVGEGLVAWIFGVGTCAIVMVFVGETLREKRHPPKDQPQ
jgi:ubiquinol-cytochrome c reductase cytochrome c subunit